MNMIDLAENSRISLEITVNNDYLEFKSFVAAKVNNYILLEAIRVDGKVINFETGNVNINVLWIREDRAPIIWNKVFLKSMTYNNRTYYLAVPSGEGSEVNRRTTFRLFTGVEGIAQVGANKMAWDVIVKNVSETGFAFVSSEKFERAINSTVRLVFYDLEKKFNLTGHIVRTEDVDESRYVYGCVLMASNPVLNQYIIEKQRDMISKQRERFTNNKPAASKTKTGTPKKVAGASDRDKMMDELMSNQA